MTDRPPKETLLRFFASLEAIIEETKQDTNFSEHTREVLVCSAHVAALFKRDIETDGVLIPPSVANTIRLSLEWRRGFRDEITYEPCVEAIAWLDGVAPVAFQRCPKCGAQEVGAMTGRTVYLCGSSDYDQRPDSFAAGMHCPAST